MAAQLTEKDKFINIKVRDTLKQALLDRGLIDEGRLKEAEAEAVRENQSLGSVLVKSGFISGEGLTKLIGELAHVPYVNIRNYTIDDSVLNLVPENISRPCTAIPLFKIEDVLTIAMSDPLDIGLVDKISLTAGCRVEPVIAHDESINMAIDQWYGVKGGRKRLAEELADEFVEAEVKQAPRNEKGSAASPAVKLVNSLISQAMLEGASDIHLEPGKDHMLVRFRIDGFLYKRGKVPLELIPSVTSRIKVVSGLDISKKRVPQSGRLGLRVRDRSLDVRTSTFPSMYGENVVLRVLVKSSVLNALTELGFSETDLKTFQKAISAARGLILATGPTGSGKTTTIYSSINSLTKADKNIMTIEDPIEYEIPGVVQSQVDPKSGVTFANALRSILRQDPDIVYVGEVRDLETAEAAVRAALTGHLVLSTLHTNDAVGAITRLRDLGVDPRLIESVLNCVFAQRLVRTLCPRCRKGYSPEQDLLKGLGLPLDTRFYTAEGCEFCSGIGYRGRTGIFEMLVVGKDIRALIAKNAPEGEILKASRAQGMKTLFEDGLEKVLKGVTSLEEVMRVTEEGRE